MMTRRRNSPGGNRGHAQAAGLRAWEVYHKRSARLPGNWRDRLPEPANYYSARLPKLSRPNGAGWAQARCPFHEDRAASLSVNLVHGGWRCFAGCGAGDLLSFHERLTGMSFRDAVAELTGGAA